MIRKGQRLTPGEFGLSHQTRSTSKDSAYNGTAKWPPRDPPWPFRPRLAPEKRQHGARHLLLD
eukprot:5879272-Pyramimonas_sp.AAC.1